ncbi:uncharacterized protein LOC135168432 isoform X1 [Diachasmimorpha longicaudata]|uniref:uncharacterized protein LOC135168432 isoform X1 n=1 Tax=Diachasmimorpha longicaudata TaxID=58733 RepID=UPI0030B8DB98
MRYQCSCDCLNNVISLSIKSRGRRVMFCQLVRALIGLFEGSPSFKLENVRVTTFSADRMLSSTQDALGVELSRLALKYAPPRSPDIFLRETSVRGECQSFW